MTIIKINAITVPADSGDELAKRFAARAGSVDNAEGFEGFELLQPDDERTTWLVVTRWRDEDAFRAWMSSPAFGRGHQSASERSGGPAPHPVGISSEVWSYRIAGGSPGNGADAPAADGAAPDGAPEPTTADVEQVAQGHA